MTDNILYTYIGREEDMTKQESQRGEQRSAETRKFEMIPTRHLINSFYTQIKLQYLQLWQEGREVRWEV